MCKGRATAPGRTWKLMQDKGQVTESAKSTEEFNQLATARATNPVLSVGAAKLSAKGNK